MYVWDGTENGVDNNRDNGRLCNSFAIDYPQSTLTPTIWRNSRLASLFQHNNLKCTLALLYIIGRQLIALSLTESQGGQAVELPYNLLGQLLLPPCQRLVVLDRWVVRWVVVSVNVIIYVCVYAVYMCVCVSKCTHLSGQGRLPGLEVLHQGGHLYVRICG